MFNRSLPNLLEAVKLPTLLIWGDRDAIIPRSVGESYRASIPGSKLVVVPNSGHRPEIENRDAFLAELQGFLG